MIKNTKHASAPIIISFSILLVLLLYYIISLWHTKTNPIDGETSSSAEAFTEVNTDTKTAFLENNSDYYTEFSSAVSSMEAATVKTEPITEWEASNTMNTPNDRITYQEDFFYESLSEEVISRIYGISYKEDCPVPLENLRYVSVLYFNFDDNIQRGELICNKEIAQDLVEIFYELYEQEYPIEKIRLVDEYSADDELSMRDNNTSCFNYRTVAGTTSLSKHGLGLAIDINPFFNPYIVQHSNGNVTITPSGSEYYADRTKDFAYKITSDDLCCRLFKEHGFSWGGDWKNTKDYQHFYKEVSNP